MMTNFGFGPKQKHQGLSSKTMNEQINFNGHEMDEKVKSVCMEKYFVKYKLKSSSIKDDEDLNIK